jgi:hypothetical protein
VVAVGVSVDLAGVLCGNVSDAVLGTAQGKPKEVGGEKNGYSEFHDGEMFWCLFLSVGVLGYVGAGLCYYIPVRGTNLA